MVPVCDHGLLPHWQTVKVGISVHICDTAAGSSHHLGGVGVQLPRHLQAKKLLHFSQSVFKGIQRAAPDAVGGTDTHVREKPRQIGLDKEHRNKKNLIYR